MDGSYKLCSSAHTVTCVVQHVLPRHLHHMRKHGGGVILRHPVLAEGPVCILVYTSVAMLIWCILVCEGDIVRLGA